MTALDLGSGDILDRLKAETAGIHRRLEARLAHSGAFQSLSAYRALLSRFYGFHAAWEPLIATAFGGDDFPRDRARTHLLVADLLDLGLRRAQIEDLPPCPLQPFGSAAEAIGSMYVLEGSTLGGVVILREVGPALGLTRQFGCRYFTSYGPEVGRMWRLFRARMKSMATPYGAETIAAAALNTFEVLDSWL